MAPTFLFVSVLSTFLAGAAPQDAQARATSAGYQELRGFATVLVTHVNRVMGTEHLPPFVGLPVPPGVIVTADRSKVQLFDRFSIPLSNGVPDQTPAPACRSVCPKVLFDTFLRWWFEMGIESRAHAVQIPTTVLVAAHKDLPVTTLVEIAYAAAETRPVQPPNFVLLTHGGPAGVRGIPFYLVRPGGLTLPPGSGVLGLTVTVHADRFVITAASPRFGRTLTARSVQELVAMLRDIHRHHPNKQALVYRFAPEVTVGNFVETYGAVRDEFPVVVFGDDEPVQAP